MNYSKNNKIKNRLLYALSVLVLSSFIYLIFVTKQAIPIESNENKFADDWAINNYGQTIKNSKGVHGIDINIIPSWEKGLPSNQVVVAVIDTGIDYFMDFLQDKIEVNQNDPINGIDEDANEYIDDYYGWNFYDNNNLIYEDALYDYHGTYIATTIIKVNPNARILPVKFLKSTLGTSEDAVLAIEYAISRGAKIINCSWNFSESDDDLYQLIKNHPEILFVNSAGNANINLDNDSIYPASYDLNNIITVIAVDNKGTIYDSSGYGKNSVDIAAPGVDVKVVIPEGEETFIDGTSVATAFVSSASSILLSKDGSLAPKEIKEILVSNATIIQELEPLCKAGGILNIEASLNAIK